MTKTELIVRLSARYPQLATKQVEVSVKTILDAITKSLVDGQRTEIRGFGTFCLHYRHRRAGRNPKSGEKLQVPAKYVPRFRAGKLLRARIAANDR